MNNLNKPLNEYTIKEIYDNWEELKKEFSNIIDNNNYREILGEEFNSQKNFNAKLKFVKAIEQYKKILPNIPVLTNSWSYDERQEAINKIVNSVENVKIIDVEPINHLEYDIESKNITFNAAIYGEEYEEYLIDELMTKFMEITLTDKLSNIVKDKEGNKVECSSFKQGYINYMARKAVATRWFIRDNPKYEGVINKVTELYSQTYDGQIFDELVNIFGEEKMLRLNFEELSEDFKKFNLDIFQFSKALEFLEEDLVVGNRDRIRKKYDVNKEEFKKIVEERLKNDPKELDIVSDSLANLRMQKSKVEDEKISSKKTYGLIRGFEKMLNLCDDIPQDLKEKLCENVLKNAKYFEYTNIEDNKDYVTAYDLPSRKLSLNKLSSENANIKYMAIIEMLMHAATTRRYEGKKYYICGFQQINFSVFDMCGIGLNKGASEYFSQKLYSKLEHKEIPVRRPELVQVIKQLVDFYGETSILDAMVNNSNNMFTLLGKDGKDYGEFVDLMDEYYDNVYINKSSPENQEKAYRKIQNFLKEIEYNRSAKDIENKSTLDFRDTIKVDNNKISNYNKNKEEQYQSRIGLKSNLTREEER